MGIKIRNASNDVRVVAVWEDGSVEAFSAEKLSNDTGYVQAGEPILSVKWRLFNKKRTFYVLHNKNANLPSTVLLDQIEDTAKILVILHVKDTKQEAQMLRNAQLVAQAFLKQQQEIFANVCKAFHVEVTAVDTPSE